MKLLRVLYAQVRLSFVSAIQYRGDYLLTVFSVSASAAVEVALWRLVMKDRGQVQGFGLSELLIYLIVANITSMIRVNWDAVMTFSSEVRSGAVTRHLLKPIPLFYVVTGDWLAGKIPVVIGALPVFLFLSFFFPLTFHPSLAEIALYIGFMTISLWISAEIYFLIVLTAFWVSENTGIAIAFNVLGWGFIGVAFPLNFYPVWLQRLLDATPFPYLVYYPVMSLMSRLPIPVLLLKLLFATLMAIALSFLRKSASKLAESRLQTVGG